MDQIRLRLVLYYLLSEDVSSREDASARLFGYPKTERAVFVLK
jgi:hypothetical protein